MRRLTSIVAIFLLLIGVAPVLGCVTTRAMNHEESACCRAVHHTCGEQMKMGCCRPVIRTDATPQIAVASPSTDVQWVCAGRLTPLAASASTVAFFRSYLPEEHSPPGLLTAKSTILRI